MKVWRICFYIILVSVCFSCKINEENFDFGSSSYNISNVPAPVILDGIGKWKSENIEGEPNSVTFELERDVDYLAWTKMNGEFIELPIPKGQKFDATFKYSKSKPHTFTFKEPGSYILSIHQKPDASTSFNAEDLDFKGIVTVGKQAIKITDKGYAYTSPKQAVYTIRNNTNAYGKGNVINELIYVMYTKKEWLRDRKKLYAFYKTQFKYNNLNLQVGKSIDLLFPMNNFSDTRVGGLILKPVINKDGKLTYYGQTTNRKDNRYSKQGTMGDQINGEFTPIENGMFESEW